MIHPIETLYAGCRFRSRLEARWAVFFDCLGIQWEYEPEGYALDEETWYLPDFLLPTWNVWCEIKSFGGDFQLAQRFAIALDVYMVLCEGTPDYRLYNVVLPHEAPEEDNGIVLWPAYFDSYKERLWYEWGEDTTCVYSQQTWPYVWHDELFHAIDQARGARFEREDKGIRYQPLPRKSLL